MDTATIIEKINGFLVEEFEVDASRITPDANLRETLELDSLDYIDLVVVIESNFGFQPEMSRRLRSVRVPNRQGCLFDETGKMPVLQRKGRGERFGQTTRIRHEHVKISVAFSVAPFAAVEPEPNDSVS